MKQVLIPTTYTADPSAHVVDGRLYVYTSHDIRVKNMDADDESVFGMVDYRILRFSEDLSEVDEIGPVLPISKVPWASEMMWAPDAVRVNGTSYLYFPAKDKKGLFRIGVATSDTPEGPFEPQPNYIQGSYSIDPAVFVDDDGAAYLYFGGDMGGQLHFWDGNQCNRNAQRPSRGPALRPRVAKLRPDMLELETEVQGMIIQDRKGRELQADDYERRYFEGPWVHKYNGTYYFSYSTGESHLLAYATSDSPTGPWQYRGTLLTRPEGWTTHHSIVEYNQRWYLFYHDSKKSGKTSLRDVKMQELRYKEDGSIVRMSP